jgi:glycosidase
MHPPTGSNWNDVVQLNHDCEGVKLACIEVMDFWLDMGVDGFRLDAACYMPDEFVDGIISRIRQARSHVLFWSDGEYYAGARSAFDAWFHHEAFSLAKHDLNAWKSLIRSHRGNGIYYLTNHDTLRCGVSPVSEWDGAYCALKDLLGMSDQHVMQSWSEWRDPSTSYSFLL